MAQKFVARNIVVVKKDATKIVDNHRNKRSSKKFQSNEKLDKIIRKRRLKFLGPVTGRQKLMKLLMIGKFKGKRKGGK